MHIPVYYEHFFRSPRLGMLRGDGDVIEDAKSHAAIGLGVVPGRPDQGKGAVVLPEDGIDRGQCAACGHQGGIIGVFGKDCIDIQVAATVLADGFYLIDVPSSMYGCNLGYGRGLWGDEVYIELFRLNFIQYCGEALLFLRMAVRPVQEIDGMINQAGSCHALWIVTPFAKTVFPGYCYRNILMIS